MSTKTRNFAVLISVIVLFIFSFLTKNRVLASEGLVELRSTTEDDYHCFVASLLMTDGKFNVNVSCVDLLYPPRPPDVNVYMLWGTPSSGDKAIKIGELGVGKAEFDVKEAFTTLYVTVEENDKVKTPGQYIVMEGVVEPISFLQRSQSPTPTPEENEETTTEESGEEGEEEITDVSKLSTKDKLLLAFRRAGIAALLALVAIVGLIFVVARSRG
jgi:hypothetical protein